MRKIIIKIDKEKANYIERLNFERNFAKDVIQRIIESHINDPDVINGKAFKIYQKQGVELETEYNLAASELENNYIPEIIRNHNYTWNLPMNSNELTITINCDCEIEGLDKFERVDD